MVVVSSCAPKRVSKFRVAKAAKNANLGTRQVHDTVDMFTMLPVVPGVLKAEG